MLYGLYIPRPRFLVVGESLEGILSNAGLDELRRDHLAFGGRLLSMSVSCDQQLSLEMRGVHVFLTGYVFKEPTLVGVDSALEAFARDVWRHLALRPKIVGELAHLDQVVHATG